MATPASGPCVFISADIEGCATVVHWDEVTPAASLAYERSRRIMASEVNAAIEGAFEAGAGEAIVNDAHSKMRNLVGQGIDPRARLVSGRRKPRYMLEGIDVHRCDVGFFIGYHGAIGDRDAVMGHTYSPRVIFECRLAGMVVGELTINAAVAAHYGVPIGLVSGDATTCAEAARTIPWAVQVETKESLSYYAALCRSPHEVRASLRAGAAKAVRDRASLRLFVLPPPIKLEIDTLTTAQADGISAVPGFKRAAARTVSFSGEDMSSVYDALISAIDVGGAAA
jgi:D-amino peptidase